ncbi:MAG: alanine--glyoxylate aminotransferase family protein, partial [Planctomycetes bacterium]|nr:alanine--glyoxylate aminotransferase family protein [Planctomycetota bacterium]
MLKRRLLAPGPTPVPEEALLRQAQPVYHHRTPRFRKLLAEVLDLLNYVYRTENDTLVFVSAGTGGMEAAVANLLAPQDTALVVEGGKFGERWTELAKAYGCGVVEIEVQWGKSLAVEQAEAALDEHPDARALYITQSETSTGALTDVEAIARLTRRRPTLLAVDAITGIGVHPFKMDEWGVDIAVSGSQKGCMTPPGLAFIAVSPRAWPAVEACRSPRYYLDLRAMKKNWEKTTTPFTAAVSLIRGLHKGLEMILAEGLEAVHARHARMADAARAAVAAIGLKLVAENPANGVTAVWGPEGLDTGELINLMRDKYGVTMAGGQDKLKGRAFRIGHMGYVSE